MKAYNISIDKIPKHHDLACNLSKWRASLPLEAPRLFERLSSRKVPNVQHAAPWKSEASALLRDILMLLINSTSIPAINGAGSVTVILKLNAATIIAAGYDQ
jgi:hypothetical protein